MRPLRRLSVGWLMLIAGCVPGSSPAVRSGTTTDPGPVGREPEISIGLITGATSVSLGGQHALRVTHPDGTGIAHLPAGHTRRVSPAGRGLSLTTPPGLSMPAGEAITVTGAAPDSPVRVNGRFYRGRADILRAPAGLIVINRLGLEQYLAGVISAEMGRRKPSERAALRAQAVVSRTYALRNLGRRRAQGFDLTATVSDQVYGGMSSETAEGREAVAATRGQVLTYDGAPIEAFFYSTCGGRTAEGHEVFRGSPQPYLRSVSDGRRGSAYCSISPRFRWREEWNAEALRATLRRNLPAVARVSNEKVNRVTDIRVTRRTSSGRVGQLAIALGGPEIRVDGSAIRQVFRPSNGELLRSNLFELIASGAGRQVTHLTIEGMGAGHGVGFCQWGAVGRARAGQGMHQILAAYFPGTRLERRY